jgi:hypothetical protein
MTSERTMTEKYSAEWFKSQLTDQRFLPHHDCALCGVWVGYVVNGDEVWFRSSCGCSWAPERPSSFHEIAEWLAMQSSDEIRDGMVAQMLGEKVAP